MRGPEDSPPSRDEDRGPGQKFLANFTQHRPAPPPRRTRAWDSFARVPQAGSEPGEQREEPGCWKGGGRCREWGAAPLPSPPGGGRAGWGARARRTGSSCGPWGPWPAGGRRAGRAPRGPGLRSRLGSPALLRAARRQRAESGGEEEEGGSRTDKNTAPARGGRGRGRGAGGGRPLACPAGLRASRLGAQGLAGASVPWRRHPGLPGSRVWSLPLLSSPRSLSGSLSALPRSPSLPLRVSLTLPLSASPSLPLRPQPWGPQPVPSAWDWRPGAWWEGSGESGQ